MRVRCREKNTLIYKDPELQKRADKSVLFFLAIANFWEKHAKNCATMSMAHITLKYKEKSAELCVSVLGGLDHTFLIKISQA